MVGRSLLPMQRWRDAGNAVGCWLVKYFAFFVIHYATIQSVSAAAANEPLVRSNEEGGWAGGGEM